VFDVSLSVEKGEVFGFLGPNGAGKTTTIRHLMGFSAPQKGHTSIAGLDSRKHYAKILENVGYLPSEPAIPENLTGMQFIRMMQGLRGSRDDKRLNYLLEMFQLDPCGKTKRMSLGNKRKLAVITAFMADPDILLLDEPTSGLDPVMQGRFIEFMREEKKRGKTILLSSRIFSEVDAVCDRIAIIKDGEIVSTVNAADVKHNANKTYRIAYTDGTSETVNINDSEVNELIRTLAGRRVASFKEERFTLEKHFLHFYEKDKKGA
jgi:ABC-2 type transport system ATP-binding protein